MDANGSHFHFAPTEQPSYLGGRLTSTGGAGRACRPRPLLRRLADGAGHLPSYGSAAVGTPGSAPLPGVIGLLYSPERRSAHRGGAGCTLRLGTFLETSFLASVSDVRGGD